MLFSSLLHSQKQTNLKAQNNIYNILTCTISFDLHYWVEYLNFSSSSFIVVVYCCQSTDFFFNFICKSLQFIIWNIYVTNDW